MIAVPRTEAKSRPAQAFRRARVSIDRTGVSCSGTVGGRSSSIAAPKGPRPDAGCRSEQLDQVHDELGDEDLPRAATIRFAARTPRATWSLVRRDPDRFGVRFRARRSRRPGSQGVAALDRCAPGRTRTHDPLLRRQPLYPAELRGQRTDITLLGYLS